jgi:hypothetical protein
VIIVKYAAAGLIWALAVLVVAVPCARADEPQAAPGSLVSKPLRVTFYPILARLPIFGAKLDVPQIDGGGGESGGLSGSTDYSLNAAYMAGVSFEGDRWFAELNPLWAALSASHSLPNLNVNSDLYFVSGRGGFRLFRGVFATAGFRRVSAGLNVELTVPTTNTVVNGATKPVLWDPLVGVDWRGTLGKGWSFDTDFQGGGFGVGSDVDLSGDLYVDWQPARHFLVRFGYTVVHFKVTVGDVALGSFQRTLVVSQTLHGPALGFGIVF